MAASPLHPIFAETASAFFPGLHQLPRVEYVTRAADSLEPAFPTGDFSLPFAEYAFQWRQQMGVWVRFTLSDYAQQPETELDARIVLAHEATDQLGRPLTLNETRLLDGVIRDRYIALAALSGDEAIERRRIAEAERKATAERLHVPGNPFRA